MSYTVEQQEEIRAARQKLNRTGHPTLELKMRLLAESQAPFADVMAVAQDRLVKAVKPTKPVMEIPEPPSRNATTSKWQAFAKEVSSMEPEVIDAMGRSDIVKVLTDEGVIPE